MQVTCPETHPQSQQVCFSLDPPWILCMLLYNIEKKSDLKIYVCKIYLNIYSHLSLIFAKLLLANRNYKVKNFPSVYDVSI